MSINLGKKLFGCIERMIIFFFVSWSNTGNLYVPWSYGWDKFRVDKIKPLINASLFVNIGSVEGFVATNSGNMSENSMSFEKVSFGGFNGWDFLQRMDFFEIIGFDLSPIKVDKLVFDSSDFSSGTDGFGS